MRVVFMGSPEFALPTLSRLISEHQVVAVVCQPDRPAGRGRQPAVPATKRLAQETDIPVLQPRRLRDAAAVAAVSQYTPEMIVVAAYGQILPEAILDFPKYGSLNVHASLLPRWRGASPIQAAILHGDAETGVTIMRMDAGLDTGPIIIQERFIIGPDETGGSLSIALAELGAGLLSAALPGYASGSLSPVPQDETKATYAPLLKKSDGALDFSSTADELARQVRAYEPWPGTYVKWQDRRLAVKAAGVSSAAGHRPGTVFEVDGMPAVASAERSLTLKRVQLEGRSEMPGEAFLNGAPDFIGAQLAA